MDRNRAPVTAPTGGSTVATSRGDQDRLAAGSTGPQKGPQQAPSPTTSAHLTSANGSQVVRSVRSDAHTCLSREQYNPRTRREGVIDRNLALTTTSLLMEARGERQFWE